MRKSLNIGGSLDWWTVCLYLFLLIAGWLSICGAVYNDEDFRIVDFSQYHGKHLLFLIAALILTFVIMCIDSKFYSVFANPIYIGVIILLALVLVLGVKVNSVRAWFEMGPVRLQPAELAKVATALALARLLSAYNFSIKKTTNLFKIAFIILLPAGLIILEPDPGTAIVFSSFLLMLYREGLSGWFVSIVFFVAILFILAIIWTHVAVLMFLLLLCLAVFALFSRRFSLTFFAGLLLFILYYGIRLLLPTLGIDNIPDETVFLVPCIILLVIAGIYALRAKVRFLWLIMAFFIGTVCFLYSIDAIFEKVLKPHHRNRIEILLGLKDDLQDTGYNVNQSKVAIGSGGFWGKGFLQGTQNKYDFLPKQSKHTDFIFCTIGEEWGFVGTFLVVMAYLALLIRVLIISERQKDAFGRIYGYSVVSLLFFHFLINIAMTVGLAPVIGIPLPFISYGGSSLWSFTILLFILLKIDAARWD